MAISKMKTILKNNRNLYRFAVWVRGRLPKRCFYSPAYASILSLNKRYERPDQKEAVQATLRRRLAALLRGSLELVPYYRETVKVSPREIDESNALDALREFPYLRKATVMDNKEAFLNRRFDKESLTYYTSGGSTGRGIGVWRTKEETDIENAFVLSEWGKLGLDWERSRIVRIGADTNKRDDEDPFKYYANRLFISTFHLHARWMEEICRAIVAFKPDFIWAYPSSVEILAGYLEEHGKPPMWLKGILLSSETLQDHQYALFKRIFDAPVSSLYGLTERTNMAFSRESEGGGGFYYRLVDTYGYSENYRDEHGNDEIVGTSYWTAAMPLVRYRTSDIGTIAEHGIIRKLQGRTQDFFIDKRGRRVLAVSVNIQKYTWEYVSVYQLVQNRVGELIIRVVPRKNFNGEIKESILNDIRRNYDQFFDTQIEVVDEIAYTKTGKRRVMINNLDPR
jgi:phenylacetate-CoA ligase